MSLLVALLASATLPDVAGSYDCQLNDRGSIQALRLRIENAADAQFWTITSSAESSLTAKRQKARYNWMNGDGTVTPRVLIKTKRGELNFEFSRKELALAMDVFDDRVFAIVPGGPAEDEHTGFASGLCSPIVDSKSQAGKL